VRNCEECKELWGDETDCEGCFGKESLHSSNLSAVNLFILVQRFSKDGHISLSDLNMTSINLDCSDQDFYKVTNVIVPIYNEIRNGK
jgi:hypothetical protein